MEAGRVAIAAEQLTKSYTTGLRKLQTALRRIFFIRGRTSAKTSAKGRRPLAIEGVSFTVRRGEVIGLIGSNGAGKSTLLRILAGVAAPTSGALRVDGKVTAILEISTGLLAERTGRDNIAYLGSLYGMSPAEIQSKTPAILAFADLGPAIDMPVRAYSMGMRARLAFSIVTSVNPDILLIDEALSVGDLGFALKCRTRMHDLCGRGSTVIIVSHNLDAIREMCQRVLWLDEGRLRGDGPAAEMIEQYRSLQRSNLEAELQERFAPPPQQASPSLTRPAQVELRCLDQQGRSRLVFQVGEELTLEANCQTTREHVDVSAHLDLLRVDGVLVHAGRCDGLTLAPGRNWLRMGFGNVRLGRFAYQASLTLKGASGEEIGAARLVFVVEDHHHAYNATYYQPVRWTVGLHADASEPALESL